MRLRPPLLAACLLLAALTSCRRRAPGTCADHIDCDPGFDCVNQRCTRRPPVGVAPAAAPPPAPPPAEPEASPTAGPPAPAPAAEPVSPAQETPRRPAVKPARPDAAAAPAVPVDAVNDHLPAWKQRRKNF